MDEIFQDLRAVFFFIFHALQVYASTPEGMAELQALIEEFADDLPWNNPSQAVRSEPGTHATTTPEGFDPSTMSRSEWLKQGGK